MKYLENPSHFFMAPELRSDFQSNLLYLTELLRDQNYYRTVQTSDTCLESAGSALEASP